MRDHMFLLLAPPLALVSPVYATMQTVGLEVLSPGALMFLAGVASVGLLLGLVAAFASGKRGWWRAVPPAILTITVLLLLDMMAGGFGRFAETAIEKMLYVAAIGLIVFPFLWLIRRHVAAISFSGAIALFAATIVVPAAQAQEREAPLVYIIMDEMIGLNGIDRSIPGGQRAYEAMLQLAERHGLRVHARAFSRHFFSSRSIPAVLNFDEHDDGPVSRYSPTKSERLDLLSNLLAKKKKVVVYQSAHIDFCAVSREIDCRTFQSFDSTDWIYQHGGDLRLHVMAVANVMHRSYISSSFINRYVGLLRALVGEFDVPPIFDVHGFPEWFGRFEQDVLSQVGDAYFAHFLMPHAPTIMSPGCVPEDQKATFGGYYLMENGGLSGEALDKARVEAYQWYFDQLHCAIRSLDEFLSLLEESPAYDNATIVIHGDHGSRISAGKLAENLSDRDMIDNFSAFYAIKGPGISPGIDSRKVSVQRLTAEYFGDKNAQELGPVNQTVVLETVDSKRVTLREMPEF